MNLMDLDEAQGLTPQMVREWLLANQWEPRGSSAAHLYYQCGSGEISEALLHEDLGWVVDLLAQSYERSVQSILREINPRMRGPGYPSDAVARAHGDGGWWVFQHQEGADDPRSVTKPGELHMAQMCLSPVSNDVRFYWERGLMGEPCDEECLWWPCDANGNKVRWPEKDGVML